MLATRVLETYITCILSTAVCIADRQQIARSETKLKANRGKRIIYTEYMRIYHGIL